MSKADIEYKKLIKEIAENGEYDNDGEVRTVYADGTPAYTKSIFGVQVKFDGKEVPILTSKKVFAVTSAREMMLFWVRQTVQEKDFKKENVKVWDSWWNDKGNLGRSYAYQFESHRHHHREIVKVKPRLKEHHGEIQDSIERTVIGVGYLGDWKSVKNYTENEIKILKRMWDRILCRCYNTKKDKYKFYGEKGIFVDKRWHSFENFLRDIRYLPQFFLAKEEGFENFVLDKDYYGSNCYSKETCVWLCKNENLKYKSTMTPIEVRFIDGIEKIYLTFTELANEIGCSQSSVHRWVNKENFSFKKKGIETIEYINDSENLYRYELSRNQVVELLKNIKANPYSRRLESNFWNWADVDKKQLQECAFSTQFNVRNNRLDILLRQRSADLGLGVVFNQYQYYLLQCMIAHVSNLKVGTFTHQIGNLHYYDRHEEPLLKQLENEEYEAPTLWINPDVRDFFDFTSEDIKLIDYKHGESIKMEVAI